MAAAHADDKLTVVVQTDDVIRQQAENKTLRENLETLQSELKAAKGTIAALTIELTYTQDELKHLKAEDAKKTSYDRQAVDGQRKALEARLDRLETTLIEENKRLKEKIAGLTHAETPFPALSQQ